MRGAPAGPPAVRAGGLPGAAAAAELYCLGDDPAETTDLAAAEPELAARLSAALDAEHEDHPLFPPR